MKTYLVVTVTCPDRPGIVERITETVVRHSANWEDSRMARLGGDFAGIVMISVAPAEAAALTQSLLALGDNETTVAVKKTQSEESVIRARHALYALHLVGADHEGIVHQVSAHLAAQGINVESMETRLSRAPMSAAPLFHMDAIVSVPSGLSLAALESSLQQIGESLGVEIDVNVAEP
jgi:glycine cleavage system transcriptional repressor